MTGDVGGFLVDTLFLAKARTTPVLTPLGRALPPQQGETSAETERQEGAHQVRTSAGKGTRKLKDPEPGSD